MKQYSFEKANRSSRRNPEEAKTDLPIMKHNLGISIDDERFDEDLLDLITQVHLNILWYQNKITKETKKRRFFFFASAFLLLLLPIAVFFLATFNGKAESTTIATQITALLAGLIAFQNVVRTWMDVRSGVGIFHEAASKLKKQLFSFEHEWSNQFKRISGPDEINDQFIKEFRSAIKNNIQTAIDTENEERARFFEKSTSFPDIKVGSSLADATKTASGVKRNLGL
ncbi:MAG: hypothetical protein D6B28_08605 [Gammaproteobacteria bacterium]|nr:MAG: hypothetical protein D6B28_08605 [Gammaproteobacteria bacterium]